MFLSTMGNNSNFLSLGASLWQYYEGHQASSNGEFVALVGGLPFPARLSNGPSSLESFLRSRVVS